MKTLLVAVLVFVFLSGCGDGTLKDDGKDGESNFSSTSNQTLVIDSLEWQLATAEEYDGLSNGFFWNSDKLKWNDASSYCSNLNLAGKSDWRLPSIVELSSITDNSVSAPKVVSGLRDTTQS